MPGYKRSNTEIKFWYDMVVKYQGSSMPFEYFCKKEGINYKTLKNWMYRMNPWTMKFKDKKEEEIQLAELCIAEEQNHESFCKYNKMDIRRLKRVITYINYMKKINVNYNEQKESKEENPVIKSLEPTEKTMKFVEVEPDPVHQELITPKNDLELIISKGVKVSVSSEISSEKLITIIEFLRNL